MTQPKDHFCNTCQSSISYDEKALLLLKNIRRLAREGIELADGVQDIKHW